MNVHVGCSLSRLYMYGTIATIAAGGAKSARRESRLMKDAMSEAGKWVEDRKVLRSRRKRERCLLCSRSGSRREYSFG